MKLSLYHRHNLPSSTGTVDNNCTSHRICIVSRTLLKSDANSTSKKKLTERSTRGKLPVGYQDQFASPIGSRSATRTQNATRNPIPSDQITPTCRSKRARDQHDTPTPPSPAGPVPTTPIPYTQLGKRPRPMAKSYQASMAAEAFYSGLGLPKH